MIDDIKRIGADAPARIAAATSVEELRSVEADLLGKKGELTALKKGMGALDPEGRKVAGAALNEERESIEAALASRRTELEAAERAATVASERLDLTELVDLPERGSLHLVTQTWDRLVDVFIGMGFTVAEGPEVETDWYNFEALNIPAAHPARGMWDTLYVDLGDSETVLLRTHTSPVQIRVMTDGEPPIYAVMPGRVYRRDTADASHMPVFHQIEGLVVDRNISFADLAGTLAYVLPTSRSPSHLLNTTSIACSARATVAVPADKPGGLNSVVAEWFTQLCSLMSDSIPKNGQDSPSDSALIVWRSCVTGLTTFARCTPVTFDSWSSFPHEGSSFLVARVRTVPERGSRCSRRCHERSRNGR
jgi:phenylalanyl-tRNA synthetase alpha subunit